MGGGGGRSLGDGKSLPRPLSLLGPAKEASWVWQGRACFEGVLVPQDGDMGGCGEATSTGTMPWP